MSERLRVEVSGVASKQIREAEAWWRTNRPKAPNAVREELERASTLIALQPDIGSRARNIKLAGVRRVHLSRIRYYLYYRVNELPRRVEVLGLWHSSREDRPPI